MPVQVPLVRGFVAQPQAPKSKGHGRHVNHGFRRIAENGGRAGQQEAPRLMANISRPMASDRVMANIKGRCWAWRWKPAAGCERPGSDWPSV